jgi:hypothetical protein
LEMQRGAPRVAGQARRDVQDAVAQALGFGDGVLTAQAGLLGPDGQIVRDQRDLKPCGVGLPVAAGQVGEAHRFEAADAVFDDGVLAMTSLQAREVSVGLVGDEALKAMPVVIAEAQLRAGVRTLAPTDQRSAMP